MRSHSVRVMLTLKVQLPAESIILLAMSHVFTSLFDLCKVLLVYCRVLYRLKLHLLVELQKRENLPIKSRAFDASRIYGIKNVDYCIVRILKIQSHLDQAYRRC